jgi:hypothetical protein
MLCVPDALISSAFFLSSSSSSSSNQWTGYCDCEFSLDLLMNHPITGCTVGTKACLIFSGWIIIAISATMMTLWMLNVIFVAAHYGVFRLDSLGISSIITAVSCGTLAFCRFARAAMVLSIDEGSNKRVRVWLVASQGLIAATLVASVAFMGVTILNTTSKTVDILHRNQSLTRKQLLFILIAVFSSMISSLVLNIFAHNIVSALVAACILFVAWTALYLNVKSMREGWSPPGLYECVRQRTQLVMLVVNKAMGRISITVLLLIISSALSTFCWFYGRSTVSKFILGDLTALLGLVYFGTVLWLHWELVDTISELYRLREQNLELSLFQAIPGIIDDDSRNSSRSRVQD